MFVSLNTHAVTVSDPGNLADLYVLTVLPPAEIDAALRASGTGRLAENGSALLGVDALRSRARQGASEPDWDDRWDAMIGHARRKGWLSADGTMVEAHIERP
jgi:hypothetical protein